MAKRFVGDGAIPHEAGLLFVVLIFGLMPGCHSTTGPRGQGERTRILSTVPPAPVDFATNPAAPTPAPRSTPGNPLSTALDLPKKLTGQEESAVEFPTPPPPKDTVPVPPQAVVIAPPPPPTISVTTTPSPIPMAPAPLTEPTSRPTLAPPEPVTAPAPTTPATPVSIPKQSTSNSGPSLQVPGVESSSTSSDNLLDNLRRLQQKSAQRFANMETYTMRLRRREVVSGKQRPEELILGKFRKEPFSVYFKWVGEEGKNREVCYVVGKHEDKIHTLMAPGDLFLFAGKHFKVEPDSPLVRSNSRYPISDAGMGPLVTRFARLVTALERGDSREGTAKYLGTVKRPEFNDPVEAVLQTLPAKADPLLPAGGQRFWYFDPNHGLPTLIVTLDETGREVEYYCNDRIQTPANLDDDDFNPYRMWKAAK